MHTKGPWKAKRTHRLSEDMWYVIVDPEGFGPVVDVGGKGESGQIAEAKYLVTDPKEIEANANLIAAAPELLEALETAYMYIADPKWSDRCKTFEMCGKAIRKAEGK